MTEVTHETFFTFNKGGIVQLGNGQMIFPKDKEIAAIVQLLIVKLYRQDQKITELTKALKELVPT